MTWAVCPACRAVVDDAQAHAVVCTTLAVLTGATTTAAGGEHWPAGLEVSAPVPVDDADAERLAAIRARVAGRLDAIAQGVALMDAYLAIGAPSQAQAVAQVRTLTVAARESLELLDRLIRYTARTLGG